MHAQHERPPVHDPKEVGYPRFSMTNWAGVIGPKGLADHVVNRWNQAKIDEK